MKSVKPGKIEGEINAPGSKSEMQRVLIAAALAKGKTKILNPTDCEDALATIEVIRALGAKVTIEQDKIEVEGSGVLAKIQDNTLNCGESGTCMRMIAAVAALAQETVIISGKGSLLKRPMTMVEEPLIKLGVKCESNSSMPPLRIKGPILGGQIEVDGSSSSQFVSGLIMALPICKNDSIIRVLNLKSKDYVALTKSIINKFGIEIEANPDFQEIRIKGRQKYKPTTIGISGDWSGAAFMLVAGAVAGKIKVSGLSNNEQPDAKIIEALEMAGAKIEKPRNEQEIIIAKRKLNAFDFDATDCPDLFPPLVALAANCKGITRIRGVGRLKHKESDRGIALQKEFAKLGIKIEIDGDIMHVHGGKIRGGTVDSHNDHRIAMACAIAALNSENEVEIEYEECIKKSYPKFFEDLKLVWVKK
ncbi:3-phosphoshikimate 1-carboxyvinyltransferase [Candidatus Micrarchaeota archaeon]|nr:3-phosphoshikimate 1-carboxyvinyltransferase [Candidatus Micrarchaeota archaeon]